MKNGRISAWENYESGKAAIADRESMQAYPSIRAPGIKIDIKRQADNLVEHH